VIFSPRAEQLRLAASFAGATVLLMKTLQRWAQRSCTIAAILLLPACLTYCASNGDYRPVTASSAAPRAIELQETHTINTFHFPRGIYTLEAEDDSGFYYRAPVRLMKQSFGGADPHEGGIFLGRGNRPTLRGYVVWAAGRTRIGNLTRSRYEFRD
jgi:hypothetical protein